MLQQAEGQYTNFDKLAYQSALQNTKGGFSVNHLLDLGELPSENCAMFASTDPSPGLPTQTCTPDSPNTSVTNVNVHTDGQTQAIVSDLDLIGQHAQHQKLQQQQQHQQHHQQQDQCLKEEPHDGQDPNSGMNQSRVKIV